MGIIAEHWWVDERVHLAVHRATGLRRVTGLIGSAAPAPRSALRISRCRSVHTCLMRRPLDVVFVDALGRVIEVRTLAPWRIATCSQADHVLELRAGEASRIGIGPGAQLRTDNSPEDPE